MYQRTGSFHSNQKGIAWQTSKWGEKQGMNDLICRWWIWFMLLPFDIVAGEFGYWACSKTWGAVHTRRNSFWSLLHWRIWIGLWRCYFTNHFFLAASFGRTLEHHWRGMSTSLNSFEVDSSFNYIYTHSFIVSHPCLNQSVYYQEKIFLDRDLLFFAWVWLTKSSRD